MQSRTRLFLLLLFLPLPFLPIQALADPVGSIDTSFGEGRGWVTYKSQGNIRSFDDMAGSMLRQVDGKLVTLGRDEYGRIEISRHQPDGTLDASFAGDGLLTTTPFANAVAIVQQPSGKLVVVGADTNLLRLNADGSPDNSFGVSSISTILRDAVPDKEVGFSAATKQADGKLVAMGSGYDPLLDASFQLLARFNTDGSLDNSFASGGILWLTASSFYPEKIIQQSDGMLVISGTYWITPNDPVLSALRITSAGVIDDTFATSGLFVSDIAGWANALTQQADGRLVMAGASKTDGDFALIRLNSDGNPDATFNSDGKVFIDVSGDHTSYGSASGIVQDFDNKLVVAGWSNVGFTRDVVLVRLNANGSIDSAFGNAGMVITDMGGFEYGYSLVMQPDGKWVVAGEAFSSTTFSEDFYLWRYNVDGSVDTGFGDAGVAIADFRGPVEGAAADAILQQSNGKLLTAGWLIDSSNHHQFGLVRFNFNGSLDTTFNSTGEIVTPIGTESSINDLLQQEDGKLVAAGGYFYNDELGNHADFALARYNLNGTIDTSFGADGIVAMAGGFGGLAQSVIQQTDGKLVVAGQANYSGYDELGGYYYHSELALARYDADGMLDTNFNVDGMASTDTGTGYSGFYDVIQQSDGKIVAVGYSFNGADNDFAIARYNSDGSLDATFGIGGIVITDFSPDADADEVAQVVVQQPDGKLVVAGGFTHFKLARYNTDGSLDTTFDGDGKVSSVYTATSYLNIKRVLLQPDGKKMVLATTYDASKTVTLIRYTDTGALDTAFGAGAGAGAAKILERHEPSFMAATSDTGGVLELNLDVGLIAPETNAVFLQTDGNLVATGMSQEAQGVNIDIMFVTRFSLNNDSDIDGVADINDAFPTDPAETLDTDLDNIGNNADLDDDGDGAPDYIDADPLDPVVGEMILPLDSLYQGSTVWDASYNQ